MIPMSHLSSVQCVQIKFRPKKKFKIKVSHSVVAAETGEGGGGARRREGGGARRREGEKVVTHGINFCNFFNLISFTISNKKR